MKMRGSAVVIGLSAAIAASIFLVIQYGTASATVDPQTVAISGARIQGVGSARCLTAPSTDGNTTTISDCAGQVWSTTAAGQITSGGKCLDAFGKGTANGTVVTVWTCNGGANQQWNINTDGTITGVQSKRCLDVDAMGTTNGTKVQLWDCNGGSNQKWTVTVNGQPPTSPASTTRPPTPSPTMSTPRPSPTSSGPGQAQTVGG